MNTYPVNVGDIFENNHGTMAVITHIHDSKNIGITFLDDYEHSTKTTSRCLHLGNFKNPYDKTVYGIGYIGIGKYSSKDLFAYIPWRSMLKRCYDLNFQQQNCPTYKGCFVHSDWHNFQNYANWRSQHCPLGWHVDKDITFYGNKEYSSETCICVPPWLNSLFSKQLEEKGVSYCKHANKWVAYLNKKECESSRIGYYNTEQDARKARLDAFSEYIDEIISDYGLGAFINSCLIQYKRGRSY